MKKPVAKLSEKKDSQLTHEEATTVLTLVDFAVKALGLKIEKMPGGFGVLHTAVAKIEKSQLPEEKPHGHNRSAG